MKVPSVSYQTYKESNTLNNHTNKTSFGQNTKMLKEINHFGATIAKLSIKKNSTWFLKPFVVDGKEFIANRFFRPQVVFADYIVVPEGMSLGRGVFHANKLVELKGMAKKGSVIFTEMLDAAKGSIIEDEVNVYRIADIHGVVTETGKVRSKYATIGTDADVVGFVSSVEDLRVYGKVHDTDIKGNNIFLEKGSIVTISSIRANSRVILKGEADRVDIQASQVDLMRGHSLKGTINKSAKVYRVNSGGEKETPQRLFA